MVEQKQKLEMVVEIVSGYVSNNKISLEELPTLIRSVENTLRTVDEPPTRAAPATEKPSAAQIRKSIRPDALVSFVDGRPYKTLKRHLAKHGMTIDDYKARFGLPRDYPTTAPSYSAQRSEMARTLGLGRKAPPVAEKPPAKTNRRKSQVAAVE